MSEEPKTFNVEGELSEEAIDRFFDLAFEIVLMHRRKKKAEAQRAKQPLQATVTQACEDSTSDTSQLTQA